MGVTQVRTRLARAAIYRIPFSAAASDPDADQASGRRLPADLPVQSRDRLAEIVERTPVTLSARDEVQVEAGRPASVVAPRLAAS
jgi:hypothetical protein